MNMCILDIGEYCEMISNFMQMKYFDVQMFCSQRKLTTKTDAGLMLLN